MLKHEDNAVARINGNNLQPLAGISVTVTDKVTGLPASLYKDDEITPIAQPLTTDNNGYYGFKAPDGTYLLTFSGQRIATFTREIVLDDPKYDPYVTVSNLKAGQGAAGVGYGGRTVADKLDEITRTPEQFGALGNDAIADTAAFLDIQTWAKALPVGATAVLSCKPGRTYMVANPYWPTGIRRLRVLGNGCKIKNAATINQDKSLLNPAYGFDVDGQGTFYNGVNNYLIATTARGSLTLSTLAPADAGNFVANEMVAIASFDQQFSGSQPPSCRYFEYAKIVSANAATGVITLDRKLRHAHQSDFPYMTQPDYVKADGRARIYKLEQGSLFDIDHEYNDIEFERNAVNSAMATSEAVYCTGGRLRFNRCKAPWFLVTAAESVTLTDCEELLASAQNQALIGGEIDKMVTSFVIEGGTYNNRLYAASGVEYMKAMRAKLLGGYEVAPHVLELEDCDVRGTPKIFEAYSKMARLAIRGGSHEALPAAAMATGVLRRATIGTGVTWNGAALTIDLSVASDSTKQFVSACWPGTTVFVGVADGQGNTLPSGVFARVDAITGGLNSAVISMNFNATLAGNETLIVLTEPAVVDIRDVEVGGKFVQRQTALRHNRTYSAKNLLLRSGAAGSLAPKLFGRIKRVVIEVVRPYTGATAGNVMLLPRSMIAGAYGAQFNRNIDLKTAGRREVTLTSHAGWTGAGGESTGAVLAGGSITTMFCTAMDIPAPTMASTSDAELPIVSIEIECEEAV